MTVQVLRACDRRATPWKNGAGLTREIAAFPPGADLDSFHWRVSIASMSAGGPFSIFPGIDRVLSVLEGELVLIFDGGATLKLTAESEPTAFPGDIAVRAETPSTAVTDLNVMTRRGHAHARVNRPRAGASNAVIAGETTLILSLSPGVRIWHAGAPYDLDHYDGLLIEAARGEPICMDAASPPGIFQVDFTRSAEIHRVDAKPLLTRIP